jgi:orotidine 5'-phosphate decarboxylase subfamily 1
MVHFQKRLSEVKHPLSQALLTLMLKKETNLVLSADVTTQADLLALIDVVGSDIAVLKTHIDILSDFTSDLPARLREKADQHQFMIFEDRKFADIGHTVQMQYGGGIYHIADWAEISNAHVLPGPGIIEALKSVGKPQGRGLLLLAEMSSKGNLATPEYIAKTVAMADEHADFVMGFISRGSLVADGRFLHFTPGVHLGVTGDALGQQYLTPAAALAGGSDLIIVGRGIYASDDPRAQAALYRKSCLGQ